MTESSSSFIPSRSTAEWQALDAAHYLHPFTDHAALSRKGTRVITRADGVYLYDSDGHQILDGMSGLWCVNLGYGRRELAEVAYRQLLELPYYNSFFQAAHPPAIELAKLLVAELDDRARGRHPSPAQRHHTNADGRGSTRRQLLRHDGLHQCRERIAVLTGGFGEDELREAGAAAVFESIAELRTRVSDTPLG